MNKSSYAELMRCTERAGLQIIKDAFDAMVIFALKYMRKTMKESLNFESVPSNQLKRIQTSIKRHGLHCDGKLT